MSVIEQLPRKTPITRKIFNALCEHPYGLTGHELVDIVWGDAEDGGPDSAMNCLNVHIWRFNRDAKRHGSMFRILTRRTDDFKRRSHVHRVWIVRT